MIDTCILHDDYEDFAQKFLGVDYEDYISLQMGLPDEDELEIEYPVIAWFLGMDLPLKLSTLCSLDFFLNVC